jgi:predicted small lipoprotein YifL
MMLRIKRYLAAWILVVFLMSLTACGYFLYPERRGQTKGDLDIPIILLDGSSLLFAVVTGSGVIAVVGIVALAVDYTSGCIYLPPKSKKAELEVIPFDNKRALTKADLESILSGYTGTSVNIDEESIVYVDIKSMDREHIGDILWSLNKDLQNLKKTIQAHILSDRT